MEHFENDTTESIPHLLEHRIPWLFLGLIGGIVTSVIMSHYEEVLASYWLGSADIGMAVGLTMLINLTIAPVLASLIPALLYKEHKDPALGAGPVVTITQDLISLLVYFFVSMLIIF